MYVADNEVYTLVKASTAGSTNETEKRSLFEPEPTIDRPPAANRPDAWVAPTPLAKPERKSKAWYTI